jgi:hypothetical protein
MDSLETPFPPPKPSNPLGLTGFILSILGLFSCGFLAPIALIFSAFGLRRPPRGLAIAGLVISLVGLLALALAATFGLLLVTSIYPTLRDGFTIGKQIDTYRQTHNGAPPPDWSDLPGTPPSGPLDHWGHPYHYSVDGGRVVLLSDGPDGAADTSDDVHMTIDERGSVRAFVGRPPPWMR